MAVERVREGERPSDVITSYSVHRYTIYRWFTAARGRVRDWCGAGATRSDAAEALAAGVPACSHALAHWQRETYPAIARHAKRTTAEIFVWDESGFRTDAVHGKTWGARAHTPVVQIPSQRQGISAASAISAKGAFWFATYAGALTGPLFVDLLRRMMRERRKPLHLILDGLPAHKALAVKEYVAGLAGKLTLHYLPGYMPQDLNPDELFWSHAKRTGNASRPLQKGERLADRITAQLAEMAGHPALVRSFCRHPNVAYISAC